MFSQYLDMLVPSLEPFCNKLQGKNTKEGSMEQKAKFLGKYLVTNKEGEKWIVRHNEKEYVMEILEKTDQTGRYSCIARNLSTVSHANISNLKIEEDDKKFYLLDEHFGEGYSKLETDWFCRKEAFDYISLIKCYLQITDAIMYIHQKGFYHGNIKPENILIDHQNTAYLLDFGRSYLYSILKNEQDMRFYAPEQEKNEIYKESDIYSFGLCMIKLIVDHVEDFDFFSLYKNYKDLDNLFSNITQNYDLEDIENELFLLSRLMLNENPDERLKLQDVQKELRRLLCQHQKAYKFGIKIQGKILEQYRENNGIERYQELSTLKEKIEGYTSFWEFGEGRDGREEIRLAIGELIFLCTAKQSNEDSLFCFCILENRQAKMEHIMKYGMPRSDTSFILLQDNQKLPFGYDDIRHFKDELRQTYIIKQKRDELEEIDRKSIESEKELLKAEKKSIEEKKNIRLCTFKEKNKGTDTITFQFCKKNLEDEVSEEDEENNEKSENLIDESWKREEKDFKPQHKVIIENTEREEVFFATVIENNFVSNTITLQLEKYDALKDFDKETRYQISYDYEIEQIIWSKQDKALQELDRGDTTIPKLLRKFTQPNEFIKNDLVEISNFYNEALDENQKLAVQKALSLSEGCEVLCIQGPPGTGKTTTIVEIIKQILRLNKHDRILIASQSNQAVDNVLEKISEVEEKILRVGNDENKMSERARHYRPENVINKIIADNLERIKQHPITHTNKDIQKKLKELQEEWNTRLQSMTSKISESYSTDRKNKNNDASSLFVEKIRVIFGTLIGISSWRKFRGMIFDWVIVDEAGRATLSELLVPCIKAKHLIFVGDHKQLAPVIDDDVLEKVEDKKEAKTSFFQKFFEKLKNTDRENLVHVLTYNYRSERRICNLYSKAFYDGALIVKEEINKEKQHSLSCFESSVVWFDTSKLKNRADEQKGTGKINRHNAKIIQKILKQIATDIKNQNLQYTIGVITPYKAQKELLQQEIKKKDIKMLDIGTVDSFQGSDRDIIIYDCVRSSKEKKKAKIDFIADEKRLNVSLSRAKKLLIIVGDMDFLHKAHVNEADNPFINIIQYINENKGEYQIVELVGENK